MDPELASFVLKFQDICSSGKNATLSFSSICGKAFANLSVEIGNVQSPPKIPCVTSPSLNINHVNPSRKRRMHRRAESRRIFAEEAKQDLSVEELNVLDAAEKAVVDDNVTEVQESLLVNEDIDMTQNETSNPDDSMHIRNDRANNSDINNETNNENEECYTEEVDQHELELDKIVTEVVIYAVPPSDIRKTMQDAAEVEVEIREKFCSIGVEVQDMLIKADRIGKFDRRLVKVTPVNLRRIWGRRLGLQNCAVVENKKQDVQ